MNCGSPASSPSALRMSAIARVSVFSVTWTSGQNAFEQRVLRDDLAAARGQVNQDVHQVRRQRHVVAVVASARDVAQSKGERVERQHDDAAINALSSSVASSSAGRSQRAGALDGLVDRVGQRGEVAHLAAGRGSVLPYRCSLTSGSASAPPSRARRHATDRRADSPSPPAAAARSTRAAARTRRAPAARTGWSRRRRT